MNDDENARIIWKIHPTSIPILKSPLGDVNVLIIVKEEKSQKILEPASLIRFTYSTSVFECCTHSSLCSFLGQSEWPLSFWCIFPSFRIFGRFFRFWHSFEILLEPMTGIEPVTSPLPWACSTTEPHRQKILKNIASLRLQKFFLVIYILDKLLSKNFLHPRYTCFWVFLSWLY